MVAAVNFTFASCQVVIYIKYLLQMACKMHASVPSQKENLVCRGCLWNTLWLWWLRHKSSGTKRPDLLNRITNIYQVFGGSMRLCPSGAFPLTATLAVFVELSCPVASARPPRGCLPGCTRMAWRYARHGEANSQLDSKEKAETRRASENTCMRERTTSSIFKPSNCAPNSEFPSLQLCQSQLPTNRCHLAPWCGSCLPHTRCEGSNESTWIEMRDKAEAHAFRGCHRVWCWFAILYLNIWSRIPMELQGQQCSFFCRRWIQHALEHNNCRFHGEAAVIWMEILDAWTKISRDLSFKWHGWKCLERIDTFGGPLLLESGGEQTSTYSTQVNDKWNWNKRSPLLPWAF